MSHRVKFDMDRLVREAIQIRLHQYQQRGRLARKGTCYGHRLHKNARGQSILRRRKIIKQRHQLSDMVIGWSRMGDLTI
jgi:hypothetical protein